VRLKSLSLFTALLLVSPAETRRTGSDDDLAAGIAMERFLSATETPPVSVVTRRHLVATTKGGGMSGWVDACTYTNGSAMRYTVLAQGGSGSIRKRALIAALDGEVEARRGGDPARAALAPANYEFTPESAGDGRTRVRLKPRRKAAMLIDGVMELASATGELLGVQGRLVKSPSFWTRKVDVTRRYTRVGGVRVPSVMESRAQVFVLGASTFSMSYDYASINGARVESASPEAAACLSSEDPEARRVAADHHERGVAAHLRRSLDDASAEYEAALRIDPPRTPTAEERALVERLAPRIMTTASEPFELRDVAAIIHPEQRLVAFHLLWDDDIDYPDDNDPSDHEVVWVGYTADGRFEGLWTYFHGRVLDGGDAAREDAGKHGGRPAVLVQWGKHGSMPVQWQQHQIEAHSTETEAEFYPTGTPITLERYNQGTFEKLRRVGARAAEHPLARLYGWPRAFSGDWRKFSEFPKTIDARDRLSARGMVLVSRWNSATLNQRFLRYNFKPKLEWPSGEVQ
jgi:hypothetical protein